MTQYKILLGMRYLFLLFLQGMILLPINAIEELQPMLQVNPGEEFLVRNFATGLYLKEDGTLTSSDMEAANWRIVTNDTLRYGDYDANYFIYSDNHVMQLSTSLFTSWSTSFTPAANSTYLMSSYENEGCFKFRYRWLTSTKYITVQEDNSGNFQIVADGNSSPYNDWEFVASSHPRNQNYRLMSMDRSSGNTKYTIAYRSRDVLGDEVWLSGWVAVPTNGEGGTSSADHVLFSTHYTMCKNSQVPSQSSPIDGYTFTFSSNKPVMIEPDYLGYGITKDREHPYCAPEIMAQESTDMIFATHDLLRDLHQMDCSTGQYPTYGIGYSQGGAIILACQKYVENNLSEADRQSINWVRTCCGAGPYNSLATFSQYMFQNDLSMAVAAPLIVMGMVTAYPDIFQGIRAEDYFSDAFNAAGIIDKIRSTDYDTDEISSMIKKACGANMQGMLSEACKDMNSDLMQHLFQALGRSDLTRDWKPQADIWFFHNTGDDVVPYLNTISAYNRLREVCQGGCELYTTGVGMSHTNAAIDFMARIIFGNYK